MSKKIIIFLSSTIFLLFSIFLFSCSDDKDAKLVIAPLFGGEADTLGRILPRGKLILSWEGEDDAIYYKLIWKENQITEIFKTKDCSFVLNLDGNCKDNHFEVVAVRADGKEKRIPKIRIESIKSFIPSQR
jgi:hypothetical protein